MSHKLSPAQKAAAKAFVKHLRDLEKGSNLERGEFCRLLNLKDGTYRSWLRKQSLPSEETQQAIRDAVAEQQTRALNLQEELFGFLAVTANSTDSCRTVSPNYN